MLIVEDIVGVVVSPVTKEFSVAIQLKLLEGKAVNPKFNAVPEHTLPVIGEIIGNGFTVIETVWVFPRQFPEIVVGVML